MKTSPILKVDKISCKYRQESAVDETSFELAEGTLACLLGPSGCGKTTVLRAIAGFQDLQNGSITLKNHCISKPGAYVAPESRNISIDVSGFRPLPPPDCGKEHCCRAVPETRRCGHRYRGKHAGNTSDSPATASDIHMNCRERQQQRVALARGTGTETGTAADG